MGLFFAGPPDSAHFDLWNLMKTGNNPGGGGHSSMETMWEDLLSSGQVLYGTFTDDLHAFRGEYSWDCANPGRGWIVVRGGELNRIGLAEGFILARTDPI